MEALAAKLTNLSYEIFGIFAPGVIGIFFFLFYWWSLGNVPDEISNGLLPSVIYEVLRSHEYNMFDVIVFAVTAYFVGHLLFWLGRKHGDEQRLASKRILSCLRFRIPRPKDSFDARYKPMLLKAAGELGIADSEETWVQFFPIAKVVLAHGLSRSLVSTYQNKYTLHRSITAAASLLFWTITVSALILLGGELVPCVFIGSDAWEPRWFAILFGLVGSLFLVWGFSDSFGYNWKMFGNTIITESFALISGASAMARNRKGGDED